MKSIGLTALAFCAALLPASLSAQTSQAYGSVRGWNISSEYQNGSFIGCHGQANTRADTWAVRTRQGNLQMVVPLTYPTDGRFAGGTVTIDGFLIDAQFGFELDYAYRDIGPSEVNRLKRGSGFSVHINGQDPLSFSLSGSTAAILKIQECEQRRGRVQSTAAPAPAPAPSAPPAAPQSNVVAASCSTVTSGTFSCDVYQRTPEPGYTEAYEIQPHSNLEPDYFFKVINDFESDTWVAYADGNWLYVGRWQSYAGNCAEPKPQQGAEARANLGQDAWSLCVN